VIVARLLGDACALGRGHILEEFLDEIDVGEDHAAAAVPAEIELIDRLAGRSGWLAFGMYKWESRVGDLKWRVVERVGFTRQTCRSR
jgi:hypothetical protein